MSLPSKKKKVQNETKEEKEIYSLSLLQLKCNQFVIEVKNPSTKKSIQIPVQMNTSMPGLSLSNSLRIESISWDGEPDYSLELRIQQGLDKGVTMILTISASKTHFQLLDSLHVIKIKPRARKEYQKHIF